MTNKDCSRCQYYYRWPEHFFSSLFVGRDLWGWKWSDRLFLPPWAMCQHSSCFEKKNFKFKERIKGQYQLNKDKDCRHFKKKWYLFWSKK